MQMIEEVAFEREQYGREMVDLLCFDGSCAFLGVSPIYVFLSLLIRSTMLGSIILTRLLHLCTLSRPIVDVFEVDVVMARSRNLRCWFCIHD